MSFLGSRTSTCARGSALVSLKRCFGSRSLGSTLPGALKPPQTTKISADWYLLAMGLVASTCLKSWLKAYNSEW